MPYLPIYPALLSPYLNDTFTVQRGRETVATGNSGGFDGGTAVITRDEEFVDLRGVIYPSGKNDLDRLSDDQRMGNTITVVSTFAFRGAVAGGGVPDWVVWNMDTYQVYDVQSYQRYGLGFTQAVCGMIASNPTTP